MMSGREDKRRYYGPRILCVSPFFAPLAGAEAFCNGKFVKALLDKGLDVTVVCVDYSGHPKFSYDNSNTWDWVKSVAIAIPPHAYTWKGLSIFWGARYLTLAWARWINAVVQRVRVLHRHRSFDVIWSRGLPNVAHVVGYWLARILGIPWIANFNDPWDLEGLHLLPQDRHLRKRGLTTLMSDWWLKRVMRHADICTFPCQRLRDYHLRLVTDRPRCEVIPHIGYCAETHAKYNRSGEFLLLHAGSLGSGESTRKNSTINFLRGLRAFLKVCPEAQSKTRLLLVGPEDHQTISAASHLGLDGLVVCTGRVTYKESLDYIASASVCILVEGKMPEGIYLPSKLADYLVSRKPVIALSPAVGTIADLCHLNGITRVDVDDEMGIKSAIFRHYRFYSSREMDSIAPGDELVGRFLPENIAQSILDILGHLTRDRSTENKDG